jgi:hypothetical protein
MPPNAVEQRSFEDCSFGGAVRWSTFETAREQEGSRRKATRDTTSITAVWRGSLTLRGSLQREVTYGLHQICLCPFVSVGVRSYPLMPAGESAECERDLELWGGRASKRCGREVIPVHSRPP